MRQDPEWKGPPLEIRELPVGRRGVAWSAWGIATGVTLVIVAIALWLRPSLRTWLGIDFAVPAGAVGDQDEGDSGRTEDPENSRSTPAGTAESRPTPLATANRSGADDRHVQALEGDSDTTGVEIDAGSLEPSSTAGDSSAAADRGTGPGIRRLAPIVGSDDQSYLVFTDDSLPPGQPQQVEIVARNKSYLRVSKALEGEPVFEDILKPGDKSIRFSHVGDLWMIIGNGGGVDVYYNGKRLPAPGKFGERSGLAFRFRAPE